MAAGVEIVAAGHYAPERVVPNAEIEQRLGLASGWIARRTGIKERRWAADGETLTDVAASAGAMCLANSGIPAGRIALVILATSTPDHLLPPSAPLLAHKLGLHGAGGIDMAGACSGFLYALTFADAMVKAHGRPVLVVAANVLSRRIDFADRGSAVLFADAAGAVLLAPSDRRRAGVLAQRLATDGSGYDLIAIPAGGSARPFAAGLDPAETLMSIRDGKAVFTRAVDMMAVTARTVLDDAGFAADGITHFIPHQANARIIEAVRHKLGIAEDRTLATVERYGNSSAATIPFTLSQKLAARTPRPGDTLLMTAAGAGLTGGAVLWSF